MKSKKIIFGATIFLALVGAAAAVAHQSNLSFEVQGVEPEPSPHLSCHVEGGPLSRYRVCQIKPVTP